MMRATPAKGAQIARAAGAGVQLVAREGVYATLRLRSGEMRRVPAEFTIAFAPDGASPKQYAIKGMPTSVLIGRDGRILSTHQGFKKTDEAKLERAIVDALDSGV